MAQDVDSPPNITILEHELEFLHNFVYRDFGSTISDTLSLESELMVQQEADPKYQNPGLQSLCFEHATVRQRVLDHICSLCGKDCHSRIGLFSHTRRCSRPTNQSATQQSFEIVGCQWNEKKLTISLKRECLKLRSLRKPNANKTS